MSSPRTANLLGALVTALHDDLEDAAAEALEHGSAFPAALVSVYWAPGISIERLRRILGMSHSGAVRLLDRLERDGSLERKAGKDARSVALHLTAQGRRQVKAVLDRRRSALTDALGLLSPGEQGQLQELLEKMLGGMTRDVEHSDHICRLCDEAACPTARCPVNCAVHGADA